MFSHSLGRTEKYSNHHRSDYACLMNVCSAPELGSLRRTISQLFATFGSVGSQTVSLGRREIID